MNTERGFALAQILIAIALTAVMSSLVYGGFYALTRGNATTSLKVHSGNLLTQATYALATESRDSDGDGFYEAMAFKTGTNVPTGGGNIPDSSAAPKTDGWGSLLGYCSWDHGSTNSSTNRITGNNPGAMSNVVFAVISPGPDKAFNTSCADLTAGTVKGDDGARWMNAAQIRQGVGGTVYFGDPVDNKAALDALNTATLKTGEMRLLKDSGMVYRWTGSAWQSVTQGGGWAETVGKIEPLYIRGTGLTNSANRIVRIGNRELVNTGLRGLTLTIINRSDHSLVSSVNYDTYGDAAASDALATALNGMRRDQIGILTSFDSWGSLVTANLRTAFRRVGLIKAADVAASGDMHGYRSPYAAIFEPASNIVAESRNNKAEECFLLGVQYANGDASAGNPHCELRGWLIGGGFVTSGGTPNALSSVAGENTGVEVDPWNNTQINGNARLGQITATSGLAGYGNKLYFSGGPSVWSGVDSENTDPLWLARYNLGANQSELRLNIGDDPTAGTSIIDRFVVGSEDAGGSGFIPSLAVGSNGQINVAGYRDSAGRVATYSMDLGGPNPTVSNGQATVYLHHWDVIAHQLRYTNGTLYLEAAGNGYATSSNPQFSVGGNIVSGGQIAINGNNPGTGWRDTDLVVGNDTINRHDSTISIMSSTSAIKLRAVADTLYLRHWQDADTTTLDVATLQARVKNFNIEDPRYNDPKRRLVHSTLEGPEVGVYYRGEGRLRAGRAEVKLPAYFEALTRKTGRTVLLTPKFETDDDVVCNLAASSVKAGAFRVRSYNTSPEECNHAFYWEVKAVRADVAPLEVEVKRDPIGDAHYETKHAPSNQTAGKPSVGQANTESEGFEPNNILLALMTATSGGSLTLIVVYIIRRRNGQNT